MWQVVFTMDYCSLSVAVFVIESNKDLVEILTINIFLFNGCLSLLIYFPCANYLVACMHSYVST